MKFDPLARWRNFYIKNLEPILNTYDEVLIKLPGASTEKAEDFINNNAEPRYSRTAYQVFCQAGLQNRYSDIFEVQEYVVKDTKNILKPYMDFWLKTYYVPNPYVKNKTHKPFLLYKEVAKEILKNKNNEINFLVFSSNFIRNNYDIVKNTFNCYGHPIKVKGDILYIEDCDVPYLKKIINTIDTYAPIPSDCYNPNVFFNRFSETNFKKFYYNGLNINIPKYNPKIITNSYNTKDINKKGNDKQDVQNAKTKTSKEIKESNNREPKKSEYSIRETYLTDPSLKKHVIKENDFKCEYGQMINEDHITFENPHGNQYMEGHHIIPMSAQDDMLPLNLDRTENIISLCPICHKAIHLGSKAVRKIKVEKILKSREKELKKVRLTISLDSLMKFYSKKS